MSATYPEDSVLRRHAMAAEQMMGSPGVGHPPTDSVLLRHYRQLIDRQPGEDSRPTKSQPSQQAKPEATPEGSVKLVGNSTEQTPAEVSSGSQTGSGLIGFFKRLLGL